MALIYTILKPIDFSPSDYGRMIATALQPTIQAYPPLHGALVAVVRFGGWSLYTVEVV